MVRDRNGNSLEVGNKVCITPPAGTAVATVVKLSEGGVVAVGGSRKGEAQVTPGMVVVSVEYTYFFDPQAVKHGGCIAELIRAMIPEEAEPKKKSILEN